MNTIAVYRVYLDGSVLGLWACVEPSDLDDYVREFHKNHSSWCASNILDQGVAAFDIKKLPDDDCLCSRLMLELVEIVI